MPIRRQNGPGGPRFANSLQRRAVVNPHEATRPPPSPPPSPSSRNVRPENSPGHPANRPAPPPPSNPPAAEPLAPDPPVQPEPDQPSEPTRITQRITAALQDNGLSTGTEDGVTVSRDSNGFVTVRDDDTLTVYRADGSVSNVLVSDRDGGYRDYNPNSGRQRDLVQQAFDRGHVVGFNDISQAAALTLPDDPGTGDLNRFNVAAALTRDQAFINAQLGALAGDPAPRATQLDALADFARDASARFGAVDTSGFAFTDPVSGNALPGPGEFFGGLATDFTASADRNRLAFQGGLDFSAAESLAVSPLQSDPLEEELIDERRPLAGFSRQQADLAAAAAAYSRLAAEWRTRPANDLLRLENGETPAAYFQRQADSYAALAAGVPAQRDAAVTAARQQASRDTARAFSDFTNPTGGLLPGETGAGAAGRGSIGFSELGVAVSPTFETQGAVQTELATRDRVQTRGAVENIIGAVEGPITQAHVDQANRIIRLANERATRGRIQTRAAVENVLGSVEGPITQERLDETNRAIGIDNNRAAQLTIRDQARQQQESADVARIRGDLSQALTDDDVDRLIVRLASDRATTAPTELTPGLDAQLDRLQRVINREFATVESVSAADPTLSEDAVKARVLRETILDLSSDDYQGIGGQQLEGELRRRGFGLGEAEEYKQQAIDRGWTSNLDIVIAAAGAVGGRFAAPLARRIGLGVRIPRVLKRVNPRFTRGTVAGFVEEGGEEIGEPLGEILFTGDPSLLLNPVTYGAAAASILGSGIVEANRLGSSGGVQSVDGSAVDPQLRATGNRLLDRRAAVRQQLDRYFYETPPPGVDPAIWRRRGAALARDLNRTQADLADFFRRNTNLGTGFPAGGSATMTSPGGLALVQPRPLALPPGEARIIVSGETPDARSLYTIGPVRSGHNTVPGAGVGVGLGAADGGDGGGGRSASDLGGPATASPTTVEDPLQLGFATPAETETTATTLTSSQQDPPYTRSGGPGVITPTPGQTRPLSSPLAAPLAIPSPFPAPLSTPTPEWRAQLFTQPQSQPQPTTQPSPLVSPSPFPSPLSTPTPQPLTQTFTQPLPEAVPAVQVNPLPMPQEAIARPQADTPTITQIVANPPTIPTDIPTTETPTTTRPTPTNRRSEGDDGSDQPRRRIRSARGQYPDVLTWLSRNRHTWDPQSGVHTSARLDDTNLETLQALGSTTRPPRAADARVSNLRLLTDRDGVSAEGISIRAVRVPIGGFREVSNPAAGSGRGGVRATTTTRRGTARRRRSGRRRSPFRNRYR